MTAAVASPGAGRPLTWALCIATLDRPAALAECVRRALAQTRPISEVIIVDASADWETHKERIAAMVSARQGVRLHYIQALRRSICAQRNQAVAVSRADILVMIDDDSFMYPDCVEVILSHYEGPQGDQIAGVAAVSVPKPPGEVTERIVRKKSGRAVAKREDRVMASPVLRWIYREVLMMAIERDFVFYDRPELHPDRSDFDPCLEARCYRTPLMAGYAFTVRRRIAEQEPFEQAFLSYCPGEDTDASYRMSRHGVLLVSETARLHHAEAAAGRIRRRKATALRLLNLGYVTRKHSTRRLHHAGPFFVFLTRRILAEFLKDLLSGRLSFPQFRGAVYAAVRIPLIFLKSDRNREGWYEAMQRRVLAA